MNNFLSNFRQFALQPSHLRLTKRCQSNAKFIYFYHVRWSLSNYLKPVFAKNRPSHETINLLLCYFLHFTSIECTKQAKRIIQTQVIEKSFLIFGFAASRNYFNCDQRRVVVPSSSFGFTKSIRSLFSASF